MPDVKLGTLELVLAKDKSGVRAFQFLHAVDEPGEPGRVGTIVYDQLHHGLGNELAVGADRYVPSASVNPPLAYLPGSLFTSGTLSPLVPDSDRGPVEAAGAFAHSSSFQEDAVAVGDVYFTLPGAVGGTGSVIRVTAAGAVSTVLTLTTNFHPSGVPTFYNGDWWIGVVDDSGEAVGHIHFDTSTATWSENRAGGDRQSAFFFAVHGGIFSLEVEPFGAGQAWDLGFSDAATPNTDVNFVDLVIDRPHPNATALHALGRFVLVFGDDGQVIAVADAPPVKSLVSGGVLSANDPFFGHGARQWGADLIVPSARGFFALNIERLAGRDISPLNIQGALGNRAFRPSAMTPFGPDLLVGTWSDEEGGPTNHVGSILLLRRYPEGVFYNFLADIVISGLTRPTRIAAMEYLSDTGRLLVLVGNETGSRIRELLLPDIEFDRPTTKVASTLDTAATYGPFPGRKLALQVRGLYPAATTGSMTISVIPDLGSPTSAGTVSAKGPFNLTSARVVGQTFALRIALPAGAAAEWPRVLLPLMLDYAEEPRAGDRIRLAVEAPVGQRRVDAGGVSVEKFLKDLRDLRNSSTTITLELLDVAGTPSTFTVLVEAVSSVEDRPALKREFPSAVAFVDLRVV